MKYLTLGVMSGTSLDGMDLALCQFETAGADWQYEIVAAETTPYNRLWIDKLQQAPFLSAEEFLKLHNEYGRYIADRIIHFLDGKERPMLINSHGHTIFHQPENRLTFQLGNGAEVASKTGINTVSDFRTLNVALGGQGAPLVPEGDRLLFKSFDYCLNLGGFANISYDQDGIRLAMDICPVNIVLNRLAQKTGQDYDRDGTLGSKGTISASLLNTLNKLDFYFFKKAKSLSREWVDQVFEPYMTNSNLSIEDQAATLYEHISIQIGKQINTNGKILVTGGGAKNNYLVSRIRNQVSGQIVVPNPTIIDYKEALIFAFLGLKAWLGESNIQHSVTGAPIDHIGGILYKVSNT